MVMWRIPWRHLIGVSWHHRHIVCLDRLMILTRGIRRRSEPLLSFFLNRNALINTPQPAFAFPSYFLEGIMLA